MRTEVIYGYPCVENPHDFEPDEEVCTFEEIAYWKEAKRRWNAGERNVRGARCKTVQDDQGRVIAHITATSWGIGTNIVEFDDEEAQP